MRAKSSRKNGAGPSAKKAIDPAFLSLKIEQHIGQKKKEDNLKGCPLWRCSPQAKILSLAAYKQA